MHLDSGKILTAIILFLISTSLFGQLELLPKELKFSNATKIKSNAALPSSLILENKSLSYVTIGGFPILLYGHILYNANGSHIFQRFDETILRIENDMKGAGEATVFVDERGSLKRGISLEKYYTVTGMDIAYFNTPTTGSYSLPPINISGYDESPFYMPIHLPDGASISSIIFRYRDDSSTDNLRLGLYSVDNNAGAGEVLLGEHTSIGATTPFPNSSVFVQMSPHSVDNLAMSYYIKVVPTSGSWPSSNNNMSFVSASLKYR